MSRTFKILVIVSAMMALASCTEAQRDCIAGNPIGCGVASFGY